MTQQESSHPVQSVRVLIIGLVAVIVVLGLALIMLAIGGSRASGRVAEGRLDALANSTEQCVVCHRRTTPDIVSQYGHSTMAAAEVTCRNCYEVRAGYPGAVEHEGTYVLNQPTIAMCRTCHVQEVAQFEQSRHGLPLAMCYIPHLKLG